MTSSTAIESAFEDVRFLAGKLYDLTLPSDLRTRVSAGYFAVVQEHHHAIVILLQHQRPLATSAFAILRLQFEAYVRGMWFSHCAKDNAIKSFMEGGKIPDMTSLIIAVQQASQSEGEYLSNFHKHNWSALCSYTHTGAQQIQRWNRGDVIEPSHSKAEINEVLYFSGAIAKLSAISVAVLAGNDDLAEEIGKNVVY